MSFGQQKIADLIAPTVAALGCELWGVELHSQGRFSVLRVYIEKDGGVNLDDCEQVSRQISSLFDVEDPISGHYTLEVSSPGMDRPLFRLEHYLRYIGEKVVVKLSRKYQGRKNFTGNLVAVEGDEVVVQVENEQYVLPIECIEKAKLEPQF